MHLDFIEPRARVPYAGGALLAAGLLAVVFVLAGYRASVERREGLELRLARAAHAHNRGTANLAQAALNAAVSARAARALLVPWTGLLADLETAAHDSRGQVSILSVEPDVAKRRVHITGESKDLKRAIAYVERLQAARSLRYPMLDRHELKNDDPQHPVRFELTGEWSETP